MFLEKLALTTKKKKLKLFVKCAKISTVHNVLNQIAVIMIYKLISNKNKSIPIVILQFNHLET